MVVALAVFWVVVLTDVSLASETIDMNYAADQHTSYKISSKTWSKKMPIQWRPVAMVSGALVGANYRLTLKWGSGEWTVEVVNNVVD